MDTLRSGLRLIGSALTNSELVYSFLMGVGWFFLLGWSVALVVACASLFRHDQNVRFAGLAHKLPKGKLPVRHRVGG